MNVTFVTAFLSPRNANPYRNVDVYMEKFRHLQEAGVPLIVYTDNQPIPNAKSIVIDTHWLPTTPVLPSNRNQTKDTEDYFCIQAMKLAIVADAVRYCSTPYLAWVDFGVFHMIHDIPNTQKILRDLAQRVYPNNRLIAPGCWPQGDYGIDSVAWRFCGSFVLGHRSL